jgi:23S rRNA (guanine2445-N2)-methyltransferase / 23S rRNA (guanine2069-N7)-methyltransferase
MGVEPLLADEVRKLGADDVRERRAVVTFAGPLLVGYRVCLWSRIASRVLLTLAEFPAATADELYEGASVVPWEQHMAPDGTLSLIDIAEPTRP